MSKVRFEVLGRELVWTRCTLRSTLVVEQISPIFQKLDFSGVLEAELGIARSEKAFLVTCYDFLGLVYIHLERSGLLCYGYSGGEH